MNAKQKRFADEYLIDLNATQAAIRAGYSKRTAYSQGQRLLSHVEVAARIIKLKDKRSEKTKINAEWLLLRLAELADVEVSDAFDGRNLKRLDEMPAGLRRLISGFEVSEIEGKEGVILGYVKKLKLADRVRILELIGKHIDVSAFKEAAERSEVTIEIRDFTGQGGKDK